MITWERERTHSDTWPSILTDPDKFHSPPPGVGYKWFHLAGTVTPARRGLPITAPTSGMHGLDRIVLPVRSGTTCSTKAAFRGARGVHARPPTLLLG